MRAVAIALASVLVCLAVGIPVAEASQGDAQLPLPGLLPGHPLYFLKRWGESIRLAVARGAEVRARLYCEMAQMRLAEALALEARGNEARMAQALEQFLGHVAGALETAELEAGVLDELDAVMTGACRLMAGALERGDDRVQMLVDRAMERFERRIGASTRAGETWQHRMGRASLTDEVLERVRAEIREQVRQVLRQRRGR